jgi:hypothetical protein
LSLSKFKVFTKVHASFMTCKCDAIYMLLKQILAYNIKKLNLKMLTCFDMIWNCDNFSRQNTKFGKICTLSKKKNLLKIGIVKKIDIMEQL